MRVKKKQIKRWTHSQELRHCLILHNLILLYRREHRFRRAQDRGLERETWNRSVGVEDLLVPRNSSVHPELQRFGVVDIVGAIAARIVPTTSVLNPSPFFPRRARLLREV